MENFVFRKYYASWRQGYTLVEIIVLISIIGFVSLVMALTFGVVSRINLSDTGQSVSLNQVHQAGSWISRDVESAENITAGSAGSWHCAITRFSYNPADNITTQSIEYVISNGVLLRKVNGSSGTPVAEYMVNPGTDTTFVKAAATATENNTYILTVKATYQNSTNTQTFKIFQRIH